MSAALGALSATGELDRVLSGYLCLIQQHDVGNHAFRKSEGDHRDRLGAVMFGNPAHRERRIRGFGGTYHPPAPAGAADMHAGFQTANVVDLLIEESDECYTVVELKNIPIDFLILRGNSRTDAAEQLVAMTLPQILKHPQASDQEEVQSTNRQGVA